MSFIGLTVNISFDAITRNLPNFLYIDYQKPVYTKCILYSVNDIYIFL